MSGEPAPPPNSSTDPSPRRATVPLREIIDDVMAFVADIVYCTVTTVDPQGRPRSRVMHPIFERVDDGLTGWALTGRSPVKTRHLAHNPHVSCSYWSPAQNTVAIDCVAAWVDADDDVTRRHVWSVFTDTPAPLGWGELSAYEPEASTTGSSNRSASNRGGSRCCGPSSSPRVTSARASGGPTRECRGRGTGPSGIRHRLDCLHSQGASANNGVSTLHGGVTEMGRSSRGPASQ